MRFSTTVLLIAGALPLAAADFAGKWKIDGDVQGNPVGLACDFQPKEGGRFSGKCTINSADSVDVEGAVNGAKVAFSFTAGGYTLTYAGKLQAYSITGDIDVAGTTGSFSGKRQPQ